VLPVAEVPGVGAVVEPVPPVAAEYHFKEVPVAVSAVAVAYWQYSIGVDTVGVAGFALTVTVMLARGPSPQAFD
jgi:hypothetical protein